MGGLEGSVSEEDSSLTYRYRKNKGATDIIIRTEWSTNLTDWFTDGINHNVLSDDGSVEEIEDSILLDDRPRLFMRLRIERP